jgi:hypothetical protein
MVEQVVFMRILGREEAAAYEALADQAFAGTLVVAGLPQRLAYELRAAAARKGHALTDQHPVIAQLKYYGRCDLNVRGEPLQESDGLERWAFNFRVELPSRGTEAIASTNSA